MTDDKYYGDEPEDPIPHIEGQESLFARAQRERDEGIAQAERNAREEWNAYAREFLIWYLERHPTYHGDDIWDAGLADPPNDRRAIGARVQEAKRKLWIRSFNPQRYRPSVQAHLRPTEEYASILYQPLIAETSTESPPIYEGTD
jgi:hypothetical protein